MDKNDEWKIMIPIIGRTIGETAKTTEAEFLKEFGISSLHISYLVLLSKRAYTQNEMSEILMFNKANTSRAIKTLRELGYVTDNRETSNSRNYHIQLTPSGIKLAEKLKDNFENNTEKIYKGITDSEKQQMLETMKKILMNINPESYVQISTILKRMDD